MINKIKTPKLKSEDRIKLIDRPDLLMVIPLTHAASVRYGANTEWCTAVPSSDVSFNDYTNEGFLVYIIYYNVVNKKRSEERYKIALYINVDVDDEEFEMSGFAKDDTELDVNFIEDFLLDKEMQDKIDYYYIEYKNSKLLDFKINSEIDCSEIKNRIFTIKSRIDHTHDSKSYTIIYFDQEDIGRCEIIKSSTSQLTIKIKELKNQQKFSKEFTAYLNEEILKNTLITTIDYQ